MTEPGSNEDKLARLLRAAYTETPALSPTARVAILERTLVEVRKRGGRRAAAGARGFLYAAAALGLVVLLALAAVQLWYPREAELATLHVQAGPVELQRTRTRILWFRESSTVTLAAGETARLAAGDRMRTGAGAAADIAFAEGSTATLAAETELAIARLDRSPGGQIELRLEAGQAAASVHALPSRAPHLTILTPAVSAVAEGTRFAVAVIAADHTFLAADAGTVRVRMQEQEARLGAGEELDAILGQPLVVRSQTPPQPALDPLPEAVYEPQIAVAGQVVSTPQAAPAVLVEIYVNDALQTTLALDAAGRFSWDYTAPGFGSYRFHAVAQSARGKAGAPSAAVSTTYSKRAPAFQLARTGQGELPVSELGQYATRESVVTLVGRGTPGETVVIYLDGVEVGRAAVDASGSFTFQFTAPAEGAYPLRAVALDDAGYASAEVLLATIVYDITPPILRLTRFPGDEVSAARVTLGGQTEPGAGLTMNGAPVAVDAAGSFTFEVALAPGPNAIRLIATDAAGNTVCSTSTILRK